MEEIEGRFELIRIAAQLGDYEVIDTQIRRLRNMSTDKHLHAILYELEGKNFRQALYMMRDYAETLRDDFFDPPTHKTATPEPAKPEPDLFTQSTPAQISVEEGHAITLDEMLAMTKESATSPRRYQAPESVKESSPKPENPIETPSQESQRVAPATSESAVPAGELDPLFTLDQDIVTEPEPQPQADAPRFSRPVEPTPPPETQHEEAPVSSAMEMTPLFDGGDDLALEDDLMTFPPVSNVEEVSITETTDAPDAPTEAVDAGADTGIFSLDPLEFAETEGHDVGTEEIAEEIVSVSAPTEEKMPPEISEWEAISSVEEPSLVSESSGATESAAVMEAVPEPEEESTEPISATDDAVSSTIKEGDSRPWRWEFEPEEEDIHYEMFAYMGQKFRNMMHQYPQREVREEGTTEEVQDFIQMVSTRDYAESQVEAAIERYQELKEQGRIAEAAQMLIAAATTESTFAQFMLARELFKGEVLQQNFPESFTQINRLAEEDYPEAICDLGQLYEYGIGIDKNKQHALLLYEEAAQMGVERAQRHYERLRNSNPLQSIKSLTRALLRKKK